MRLRVGVLILLVVFAFQCSHYDELQKNGKESAAGGSSHNFGKNCMDCHNTSGSDAVREGGWWNIAGSVYNEDGNAPFTNATVELWSKPNREGTRYDTFEVDGSGNFYTAKIIQFGGTCFPVVVNNDTGEYEAMETAFHSGGCSGCHGKTQDVITVD